MVRKPGIIFLVIIFIAALQIILAKPKPASRSAEISSIEQSLQGNLDAETRKSLEVKLETLYREATRQAAIAQLTAKPSDPNAPAETDLSQGRLLGVIENPSVPFSSMDFHITNAWQDKVNGDYVLVFVGALARDPQQGVALVTSDAPGGSGEFLTPRKSGAVRIVQEENLRLALQTAGGDTFYFDVPERRFVDSLNP